MATSTIKAKSNIEMQTAVTYRTYSLKTADGNELTIQIGKLDASNNYVQFYINGTDKGYIKFTVSRNINTI